MYKSFALVHLVLEQCRISKCSVESEKTKCTYLCNELLPSVFKKNIMDLLSYKSRNIVVRAYIIYLDTSIPPTSLREPAYRGSPIFLGNNDIAHKNGTWQPRV